MVCNLCGQQMHQKKIGNELIGYGYATQNEYKTVTVQSCNCGNLVLEEYTAKKIELGYADWIRRNKIALEMPGNKEVKN